MLAYTVQTMETQYEKFYLVMCYVPCIELMLSFIIFYLMSFCQTRGYISLSMKKKIGLLILFAVCGIHLHPAIFLHFCDFFALQLLEIQCNNFIFQ
jgi:hypothetical protein